MTKQKTKAKTTLRKMLRKPAWTILTIADRVAVPMYEGGWVPGKALCDVLREDFLLALVRANVGDAREALRDAMASEVEAAQDGTPISVAIVHEWTRAHRRAEWYTLRFAEWLMGRTQAACRLERWVKEPLGYDPDYIDDGKDTPLAEALRRGREEAPEKPTAPPEEPAAVGVTW